MLKKLGFCLGFVCLMFSLWMVGVSHLTSLRTTERWSKTVRWIMYYSGKELAKGQHLESIDAHLLTYDLRNSLEQTTSMPFPSSYCKCGTILSTSYRKYCVEDKCAIKANSMTVWQSHQIQIQAKTLNYLALSSLFVFSLNDV